MTAAPHAPSVPVAADVGAATVEKTEAVPASPVITPSVDSKDAKVKDEAEKVDPNVRVATIQDYLRVFKYANKWDFVAYAFGGIAAIGAGTTLPLMNVVFGRFVNTFVDIDFNNLDEVQDIIDTLALYMFLLFLARFLLNTINKFAFRMIGIRLSSAIRTEYLRSLFGQSIHVLDSMPPGSAVTTITTTANTLQLGISEKLGVFLEWTATIVTALVVAFVWSWEITLVAFSVIFYILIVISITLPIFLKFHNQQEKADKKAGAIASEVFDSIQMVIACGAEKRIAERFKPAVDSYLRAGRYAAPAIGAQFGLIFFGLYSVFALVFWYGIRAYSEGRVPSVGAIIIASMSVMMMVMSLERISSPLLAISKAMVAACEFFTVIDAPKPPSGNLKEPDVTATGDISFKNVTFAYPSRPSALILNDISLTIQAGKVTAIVGPSGSGKSTVVGLIERWYTLQKEYVISKTIEEKKSKKKKNKKDSDSDSDSDDHEDSTKSDPLLTGPPIELKGSIETNGHALGDLDLKWWRSQIGLVQQESFLFNDTIYKNVAYGLLGTPYEHETEEKKRDLVRAACDEAYVSEFVNRLPDGLDTMVGERGAKLSGGQKQRISIARSIVRKPKILILDEATSSIDIRGEAIVQAALERASQGRTTIMIAHRLSTVKKADCIIAMKNGKVMEQGTHQSLLQNEGGLYSELVYAQKLSLGEGKIDDQDITDEDEDALQTVLTKEKSIVKVKSATDDDLEQNKIVALRGFNKSFVRLLKEQKSQWPFYALTIMSSMLTGTSVAVMAFLMAKMIELFQLPQPQMLTDSRYWGLVWFLVAIGIGVSYFMMLFFSTRVAAFINTTYKRQYFSDILYQKPVFFDRQENSKGTLTSRVTGDPKQLDNLMGQQMAFVYQAFFNIIGAIIIAHIFAWKLALIGFCVAMPINLVATYWRFKYEFQFAAMNNQVFEESSKFAAEAIAAFRTVSSLIMEDSINERYRNLLESHVTAAYKKARWRSPVFGISDSIGIACQALLFWVGSKYLLRGEITAFEYFVTFMAVQQGAEAAGQGLSFGPDIAQVVGASNRILDVHESKHQDPVAEDVGVVPDVEGGVKIELQDVHFKYPTRNVPIFKGLNITIEKGQFAALVGASGCGKTSIISLLERFYEPYQGSVSFNGKRADEVNVYAWRKHVSLVAQDAFLLQGTVRENILLGVDESSVTDEQIHQACRDALIHDFVVSLPDGYNTDIGSRGVAFSGGQKQRLSIARALIRNPKLLLLDEATSSLDSTSEKLIQQAFERAAKGRTMVVVAHRLATVQNADVIFVMGEGKLLEKGSHSELLKQRGMYWRMCQNSALDR